MPSTKHSIDRKWRHSLLLPAICIDACAGVRFAPTGSATMPASTTSRMHAHPLCAVKGWCMVGGSSARLFRG